MVTRKTITWSKFASDNLKEIFCFHKEVAGVNTARKLRDLIFKTTRSLVNHPLAGQIEPSLKRLHQEHRYLVVGNYKIVYKIIEQTVLITDLFDTRQNPVKINDTTRRQGK